MKWIMCALAADKPSERYNNKNSEDEHKQKNIHNENEKNIETIKETKSRGHESFNEFSLFLVIFSLSPSLTPARFNSKSAIEFQIVCVCVCSFVICIFNGHWLCLLRICIIVY